MKEYHTHCDHCLDMIDRMARVEEQVKNNHDIMFSMASKIDAAEKNESTLRKWLHPKVVLTAFAILSLAGVFGIDKAYHSPSPDQQKYIDFIKSEMQKLQ